MILNQTAGASREPEIRRVLCNAEQQQACLEEAITRLEERLSIVLRDDEPVPCEEPKPSSPLTSLGGVIGGLNLRSNASLRRVESIIDRLEL